MPVILRFPGFLDKAVTLSYDDGVFQDERLISIMRKYGLKGTFNIPSAFMDNDQPRWIPADKAKEVYSGDDLEVAVHGAKHYNLTAIESSNAARDILFDRERLEKHFGRVIRGMAYAYGKYNDEVVNLLKLLGIKRNRLFADNVLSCLKCGNREGHMQIVRNGNGNYLNRLVGENSLKRIVNEYIVLLSKLAAAFLYIPDTCKLNYVVFKNFFCVPAAHSAVSDDSDSFFVTHRNLLNNIGHNAANLSN